MYKRLAVLIVVIFLSFPAFADYVPGEVLVKIAPGKVKAFSEKQRALKYEKIFKHTSRAQAAAKDLDDFYKISFSKDKDVKEIIKEFKKDPDIIHVQPNYILYAYAVVPNDPWFLAGNQWYLTTIEADDAWEKVKGTSEVVVAVLDSGVNYNHEDLIGKVDTTHDYDYVNHDTDAMDDDGHGTSVAGVIGAKTNNSIGIAAVDWNVTILPLKVLAPSIGGASGTISDIADAIDDAPTRGADILNMSFGIRESQMPLGTDVVLQSAINSAFAAGCVLVAAAGNDGVEERTYPAANNHVLAVAATDINDLRSVWGSLSSNYGTWVDISAPGSHINTTLLGNTNYGAKDGTSFATPVVAGVASLVKAANPTLTNQQIMDLLTSTADNIDALNPAYAGKLGSGRVNAYRAVTGLLAKIISPTALSYLKGNVDVVGTATGWDFSKYALELYSGETFLATIESKTTTVESGLLGSFNSAVYSDGQYLVRLKLFSNSLNTDEVSVSFFIDNTPPDISIDSPTNEATISSEVSITGSANDQYFEKYLLEYGAGDSPISFERIKLSYIPVVSGLLASWETTGLNGLYTLKLTAYDKAGSTSVLSYLLNLSNTTAPTKALEPQNNLPITFALPNPFDRHQVSEITFNYILEGNFNTKIYLFDITGNLLWQQNYFAGENGGKSGNNNPAWNGISSFGAPVSNGVYLYQIIADQKVIGKGKVIVLN